jgi:hypothetical protein
MLIMVLLRLIVLGCAVASFASAFGVLSYHRPYAIFKRTPTLLAESVQSIQENSSGEQEREEQVGNLVADDEWMGLSMELTELVRVAIIEEAKKSTRDFLGKDEYKVGDIAKELDSRVKQEVALLRDKDEYELGDLTLALDAISKNMTCTLTGKEEYEAGKN